MSVHVKQIVHTWTLQTVQRYQKADQDTFKLLTCCMFFIPSWPCLGSSIWSVEATGQNSKLANIHLRWLSRDGQKTAQMPPGWTPPGWTPSGWYNIPSGNMSGLIVHWHFYIHISGHTCSRHSPCNHWQQMPSRLWGTTEGSGISLDLSVSNYPSPHTQPSHSGSDGDYSFRSQSYLSYRQRCLG